MIIEEMLDAAVTLSIATEKEGEMLQNVPNEMKAGFDFLLHFISLKSYVSSVLVLVSLRHNIITHTLTSKKSLQQ